MDMDTAFSVSESIPFSSIIIFFVAFLLTRFVFPTDNSYAVYTLYVRGVVEPYSLRPICRFLSSTKCIWPFPLWFICGRTEVTVSI